jgi:hypothetical protein
MNRYSKTMLAQEGCIRRMDMGGFLVAPIQLCDLIPSAYDNLRSLSTLIVSCCINRVLDLLHNNVFFAPPSNPVLMTRIYPVGASLLGAVGDEVAAGKCL